MSSIPIIVAYGDGIGPEIMEAALHILREAGAQLNIESIEVGSRIYNMGGGKGVLPSAWERLQHTGILLKGPTDSPAEGFIDVTAAICAKFELDESHVSNGENARAYIAGHFALFETTQPPCPELAGKNSANPWGAIAASLMMLEHIGQPHIAEKIRDAWQRTLAEGMHTADIYERKTSSKKLSTTEFADAVVSRMRYGTARLTGS